MRALVLLLLSSLSCTAQLNVQQPMFQLSSVSTSITNDGALAYYWNYQDLTNGVVVAWPDRKQNLTWLRYNTAAGPNKTASGVVFTNTSGRETLLTNTAIAYTTNMVVGLVYKPTRPSSTYGTFLEHTNASFWTLTKWSGDLCYLDWGAPGVTWAQYLDATKRQFTLFAWSNTFLFVYTNKVDGTGYALSKVASVGGIYFPGMYRFGGALAQVASMAYQGTFQEIIIWTNVTDIPKYLTNYWSYVTNTYTFP